MADWKIDLGAIKKQVRDATRVKLTLPGYFNFKDHDSFDFDKALSWFDWTLKDQSVQIDFTNCKSANYQTLTLVVL